MLSSTRNNTENENIGGALRGKSSVTQSNAMRGKSGAVSGGLSLRSVNVSNSDNKTGPSQQPSVRKRKPLKPKVKEEDEIEYMPAAENEPDTYEDILPFDQRPAAEILRRIFCIPHSGDDSEEEDEKEEIIQWPSISRLCPFSDDPNMLFAEITDEFEPCSLSESEDDSHGGTKTHMS